jgi:uncharacterized protein YndB with AHSA1/START domain
VSGEVAAPAGDRARVSVFVRVAPSVAFDLFTREIDLWWKQGPKFRIAGRRRGQLQFEGGPGGRLFETFETGTGAKTFEVGRITAWEPPALLRFDWRGVNFKAGESTVVEVRFDASGEGTMVTVEHRGWSTLAPDHPVRHGLVGPEFIRVMGMWWGELMTSLRAHASANR